MIMGEKRVELHLHTNMSQMQGITSVQEYIEKGLEYNNDNIKNID